MSKQYAFNQDYTLHDFSAEMLELKFHSGNQKHDTFQF